MRRDEYILKNNNEELTYSVEQHHRYRLVLPERINDTEVPPSTFLKTK